MFKSLKTRFFTQYHLFVFIAIFALKNPRNPCGLWDFTDVIYFGRQSWLRYRGTVRFTFFRPLLRFPKFLLVRDSTRFLLCKNLRFDEPDFCSAKTGSLSRGRQKVTASFSDAVTFGLPYGIRTHHLQSRSLTLYPNELRAVI